MFLRRISSGLSNPAVIYLLKYKITESVSPLSFTFDARKSTLWTFEVLCETLCNLFNYFLMLKIILLSALLVLIAILALGIRILIKPKGEFSGGYCNSKRSMVTEHGISFACGGTERCMNQHYTEPRD